MSQPKLFFTGVTGYIGGDVLHAIYAAHPDWAYTCLVRNSDKGAQVASQYAKVKLVYGDLDSIAVLEEAARNADVTIHCAHADHEVAAGAILKGIAARPSSSPGFLIHTSGTGILTYEDIDQKTFGSERTKIWDDIKDIKEINQIPDHAPHRNVDKIVLESGLQTAIVCPPMIYGVGRGPGNQRSIQVPTLARLTLERGKSFYVGEGKTHWTQVHIHDLSQAFLRLAEEAVKGGGSATWGSEGYYYTENGDFVWSDVSRALAKEAKKEGLIDTEEVESLTAEDTAKLHPFGPVLWGGNCRVTASRARRDLGWMPVKDSVFTPSVLAENLKAEKVEIDKGQ